MSKATATSNEKASATVTIIDLLRLRAETQRDEIAYRFLADGEEEKGSLTYGELYRRARQIAAELQKQSAAGQRALLLDSSESDYIVTFFGCLCAGVIAVPIYAPRVNKKGNARVESVMADAQPSVVLTAGAGSPAVRDVVAASAGEHVKWIDTNALPADGDGDELWTPRAVRDTDIAFLQYTSGSTAAPKGVMVSHANILHNERMIQKAFDTKPGGVIVGWLPLYHDMGLIGNVLQPLYAGVPSILMSPVAFLQRPLRWLQAISRYQATTSGGPNFAYELCMRKIRPEERSGLDLSSWRVAFNGAEPVRPETLNRFAAQFADCGFRREAFVPCYGLAEATLFVSGGLDPNGVTTANQGVNGNATNGGSGNGAKISRKQDKLLVACGRPPVEQAVRIVLPDSLRQCSADEVGEIWVQGPSVARGYWRKAKETEETFKARIPETGEGPFLRTGDLGFLKDGHLFITGRLKDLLIIRGQNYYPQDIELTVEQSHPVLQPGSGAAFSVEIEGEERLVVVQEVAVRKDPESIVQRDLDELDAVIKLISRNIVAGHELQAFAIVLIRKGTIPKTSSGKIQRRACRDAFLNRELHVLREWHERESPEGTSRDSTSVMEQRPMLDGLAPWLVAEIARVKRINQQRVDLQQPFTAYGLDSLDAVEFAHKLQTEFEVEVEVSEFFSDSTITEIIQRATDTTGKRVSKRETKQPARYPLSYGQRALWFVHQTAPESAAYNIARVIRIATGLDVGALRLAFQALVDRHPCLRTIVVETAGEPVQQVAEKVEVSFEYFDARDWSQVELEKALVQQNQRPFSLTLGPLFRTVLYARSEKEYLLHVAVHHMVADYWTLTLLLDEIGKLYQAYESKVEIHLVPLEYSYADYVEWQREKLSGPAGERLRDYWKNELAGELPPLSLPADHARPPVQTFRGSSLPFSLDAKLTERLKRLGGEQQATLFTTLLAAFQVLLYRLTSQKQVIVGCPIAGRSRAEFANIAGYFVNAVPLRADFQQRQTFTEFLSQVRNRVSKAFAHELYPFSLMVEQLGIVRDPAVPPIFQSAFVFQQTYGSHSEDFVRFALGQPQAQVSLGGLQLEHVVVEQQTASFDLTLSVGEGPDGLVGSWEYSSDLFEKATIARWAEGFSILLEEIISRPDISVSQLPILSDSQYDQLVEELNRTTIEYDRDQCLHELIEEQAKTTPASAAIVCRETELSYTELNERANQVARYLLRSGVRKEDLVGVCMRRSPEMVVAMLGIWKANAAYVPLDPQYPEGRLRFMLEDADAKAVITEESLKERVGGTSATVLNWDGAREQIDKESSEKVGRPACSQQLAYLIYTSGSSGAPKGVMLTHRNAVSFVAWAKQAFTEEEFSGVLAATSICFDLSIFELWATLGCGGTVVLADDVISWWESLQGGRVTNCARLLNTVPSAVAQLMEQGPLPEGVVTINLAGEALKEELVSELRQWGNRKRVNNLYGPTETTTYSSWTTVEAEKKVTIGRGVGNTRLYVLDQELDLALSGVMGELYIAGAGVGRGYWGQASLTAERFLPDPYSKTAGDRMYRTGDLVRWNNAGQMEYLGRADQQVKVRGYRIELGEIEASVSRYPAVRENVVVVRESGHDRSLVLYTAPRAGMEINEEQLREYLRERLPRYMLPSTFMILESLPKTPNGKVDRKALPEPRQREMKGRKPQNETEEMVAAIWAQVMQLDQVGVEENFFGLGGHSLLAMQVTSRIRQVFAVELQLRSFLENPTVAGLALQVDKAAKTAIPPLLPLPRRQHLRLSFAQERLRFLSRYETEACLYNVPVALRLRGTLSVEAVKASLQEMVNRHEVLRTSFPEVGDGTIQDIAAEMEVPFAIAEIREDELDEVLREQARRSFDLSHGPLIRASLFHIGSQDHVLLVVMHHIVSDGWSLGVMLREFNVLYDSFSRGAASPLPPLPIQYADYSEWQREWLQGEVLERQLDYWRKQLAGHETLNLPTDRPHSARPALAGAMETARLPEPLVSKLKFLSDQQGVTLFMTLLAGFEILLYRYTGQTDISVGSGIANRNRQELEPLIGFFVNTLVLRTQFTEDSSAAELLQRVRDVSLQAYAHQDIPFERLVEALDPVRELSRTPFFQALFALQNAPLPEVSWDGLEATASILETGTAKFDLTLAAREEDGELELSLEYRTELFNVERMRRLLQHYRTLLEGIAVSVDARIGELELLSEAERQQLLVEWNRTEAPYSTNQCVHQLFEEQAAKTPQAVAVMDEDGQISYGELNRRANQLAHYLTKLGIGPEVRVAICMERSLEMMVGILGVLKAGGAYVPLDPADLSVRRSYMVKDAGAKFVLTNERFIQQMAGSTEHVADLEEAREEIERQSGDNLNVRVDPENLAWVIYTSSSAGRPKGTAIPHCSAVSLMQPALIDAMDQNPSVERWLNLYAPTEDTTYSTYAEVKHDGQGLVTIGRSQSNTQAYVLDGHMKLVPVGIKGELYLGGAGQARGYLSRPELTAERFVPNPFSKDGGERLYRTGDLVRYQENGNLEFLGRLDSQVKIQGHRIEPEEIEAALLDYPGVTQAAVITREDKPGNVRLAGYVASSERLDVDRLRSHLQQRVPEYMVPAALLQLDTLPLTPNGKVDRKALIELESKEAMETGSLALTPTEELIAGVWSSLLEKSDIRRDDNFFDLGGHSLTVIQMLSRLERVFNREIELRAMFEFPVLKDFSAYVDQLTGPAQLATLRPIVPTSRDGGLPLSFAQQRLWFLAQMEGSSEAYHIPFGLHLKGDLNRTALRGALDRIVVRHEVLRTTFAFLDGEPVQEIGAVEESSFRLIEHDLRGHNEVEAELAALSELEAGASFDLEAGPLIRGRLIRLAEDEHVLLITMHHIVSDGWSMGVLVRELNALYGAFLRGEADPLPELEIQYADYAVWQRQWIEGEILQQQAAYWKTTLAGAPALLELPTDHTRPVQRDFAGGFVELVLDEQLTAGLKDLSRRHGTTLYMTLLAGWAILLARLSGQQDVVIGSPVANRGRAEIENLIGFFVNTLALRLDLSGSPSVSELLEQTKAQSLAAQRHQDIPFEQVVELAQPVRSLAHSPLFQVMFAWQNATEARLELPGLEVQPLPSASYRVAKFDLTLSLQEMGERIVGALEYATALYERSTLERYREYFLRLVEAMVADDSQVVDHLRLLTETERHQVSYEWNATEREYPRDKCVHELFEEQVGKTPEAVAVVFEDASLSYAELNRRANRLAHQLRKMGVGPEARVAICVERGLEMIVALLAVLKAGAGYLPLDPSYPVERLRFMQEDAALEILLTQQNLNQTTPGRNKVIFLDRDWKQIARYSPDNPVPVATSENLAYVIYTSGSTGVPKGVVVEHRQLLNQLLWCRDMFRFGASDRVLQKASLAFDVSILETLLPLISGARIVMARPGGEQDPNYLVDLIRGEQITYVDAVPTLLDSLLGHPDSGAWSSVRLVTTGGEALNLPLVRKFHDRLQAPLWNCYGPTETTIQSTVGLCEPGQETVSIGRPIANTQVYVLDSNLNLAPIGVKGELYIGGDGVARGYLNRAELTAERFLADPFSTEPGVRMYRTGDLGRWLPDGTIEFLGRNDFQVKIRGFRIELREIESRLLEHEGVREAVVVAREDTPGDKRLVAYLVPDRGYAHPLAQLLRLEQSGELPRAARYELPNGMVISHQNKSETDFVYQEIFEQQNYLRHGITVGNDACVFDVGANIGLFTLSVLQRAPGAKVYAFEPIPPIFESLRINSILSGGDVHLFNCGLSSTAGTADFTWVKHNSVISGRYADLQEEQDAIKTFMKNQKGAEVSEDTLDGLIQERLEHEQFRCSLRTLSEVIAAERIERIDLLKSAVEKSELEVFEGIERKDWPKIGQLVIEVHDIDGRLGRMQRLLEEQGYRVSVEQDRLLAATNFYTIFAQRPERVETDSALCASSSRPAPVYWNPKQLVTALRAHLSAKLPEYMVPNAFVFLPVMPLTVSGKIDRKALPLVKSTLASSEQAKLPLSETERIIADIWKQILKIEEVGVEDKFFDVGGHSLLLPRVGLELQNAFGVNLQIVELFQYSTIRALAERLQAEQTTSEKVAPVCPDELVEIEPTRSGTGEFAIVGMVCRLPGANNIEEFWQNLQAGVESIIDFSDEELRAAGIGEELLASPNYVKRGAVVSDVDLFDARFFDISAREAELIDPQQRIFLECAWEALENAGYTAKTYPGKIGLYAGGGAGSYFLNLLGDELTFKATAPILFANSNDFLTTRVSYKLDLTGPSVTVQTACSTSLVAVHMACRALLNHECDIAMAGGMSIQTPQNIGDVFQEGGILSPDGHSRTFDERAQGTLRGGGGGIVVIKRLEDAVRDGDHIRAVIKGSAINNDGGNKLGYTAPSVVGQCNVIRQALLDSGVSPETITYVEAHGTATSLGDPIEVSALTQAYREAGTEKNSFCAIGSVKSNIGHADAAAGIAGLIKTVLALEHKLIPPTLHFERPNPKIDFDHSPFYVNTKLNEWNTGNVPRRAGVSSFGIGGTNAHVIVEEAPSNDSISACRPWQLVLLSAKTATALETAADNLGKYLQKHDSVSLADVAHTLQVGRAPFAHRCFVVEETVADTSEALQHRHSKSLANSIVSREACRVAFLFPGQGSQYVNMGKHLYSHEPLFRELVDQCSELLQPSLQFDLRKVLYPSTEKYQWAETELRETRTTQPALFVIEYALARVWMSWGLQPESMVGHSIGEYVAACLAGVFSLKDALSLIALRGRLMHGCERGGMLAVAASEEEVQRYLKMGLELAAINGSRSCVLTGPLDSLELAEKELVQQQVIHRRLQSSHAFHSSMMEPIVGQFAAEVQKVRLNAPRMRYLSNLTGDWITVEQATDPVYWSKQLRSTVQFAQALRNLFSGADRLALEVGPGHSNSTAIRQTIAKPSLPVMLSSLPDANTEESDVKQMLTALGQLWLHGADVDWNAFASGEKRRRLPLPTYPFERQRYWVESPASRQSRPDTSRRKLTDWLYLPSWKEARRVALSAESEVGENSAILVFGGNSGMAEKLALRLEQKRYGIVTVVAGREFARIDHRTYAINPAARSDYEALFSALREQGQLPKKILHLWNVGHNTSLERDLDLALYSPLHMIQAATAEPSPGSVQCMIMSSGLHEITGNESLFPGKATLLGLCKTVPWELPDFVCKVVDIEVPAVGSWIEHALLDQLVRELESKEQDPVVSYRGARRWIQTFEQSPLEAAGGLELIRERGVYLITGGLNEVGFEFAEWLASDAHAAVVLVDSLPFPPREQWDTWSEIHVGDSVIKQIDRIRRWEQGGAKVFISNVNVADQNQMREVRDQVREVWGKIDGVIHAAGFSERAPIASKTRSNIAAVLAPKIQGALVLDEVFAGEDLDFMAYCSSLISVVGEAEQADYAAANAFLDSLARRNFFRSRCFTMSINWDVWEAPDSAVSSAANGASPGGIRPDEAVEVLQRLLRAKLGPQAIISTRDLALAVRRKKVDPAERETNAPERIYDRNLDRPVEPPTNSVETLLIRIWTEVLGVSPIGIRDDFFDLGGDSLIGLRMTARLEDLGIHVSLEQLFRHRTIQELAGDVEQAMLADGTVRLQLESATPASSPLPLVAKSIPIRPVDRKGKLALSYGQQRLWYINQLEPENVSYNMPDGVRIAGPLDAESLARTVREVVRRHESLRTRFVNLDGEPQQIIDASIAVELPVTDLSHLPEREREAKARRLALEEARQPFDLARGPLFRVELLRLASQDHVLVFNMHHIVSDQWSVGVLVSEVSAIYKSFSAGQPSPLPELEIQYADYSAWQRELLSGPLLEKQLGYWKRKLAAVEPLMLPTDRSRSTMQRQDGATAPFTLPLELTEALKNLSRKQGATLYMILLATFQALLSRYSGQYDLTVGSPIAGRSRTETEGLIGFFLNTLVMRTDLTGRPDSINLLQRVKETTLEAYAHQDVPFEKLVEVLKPARDLTRTPLFQVMFVLQNVPWTELELGAAKMLPFDVDSGTAQFEISLVLVETGSGMEGFVEYNTDLFEAASVTRMIDHYRILLSGIVAKPDQPIAVLPLLAANELKQIVEEWNRTTVDFPTEECLPGLIEQQVARTPNAIAVEHEGEQLSYSELNERANQLAWRLRELGVGPETRVGVMLQRSLEMVMGLLGVLKAGGAYVPLDPEYPAERLDFILEDAQVAVLLTQEKALHKTGLSYAGRVICWEQEWPAIAQRSRENLVSHIDRENLAYLIYTSGSTGRPKAVGIRHGGVATLLHWAHQVFSEEDTAGVLASTSMCFDLSVFEMFVPLSRGGRVLVVDNALKLTEMVGRDRVTLVNTVPSAMAELVRMQALPASVRVVNLAGEALSRTLANRVYEQASIDRLFNLYGPSEDTTYSTYELLSKREDVEKAVSIGRPISNSKVSVLDDSFGVVPVGVAGELYIGGDGLARGYLNRPELTAEKFVPNPFSSVGGERLYRTGDRAKWRGEGKLDFLGRLDHQVKVRGFRIELGEIESALARHPGIQGAAVVVQDQDDDRRLIGYFVSDQPLASSELREQLRQQLPEHMVPAVLVRLKELPLTPSGKVNRAALPAPDAPENETEVIEPRNELEEVIAGVWRQILHLPVVNINASFFDLGGHSLSATRLVYALHKSLGVDLPLRALDANPTIAGIAAAVVALREGKLAATPTVMSVQSMLAEAVLDPKIAPNSASVQRSPLVPGSNLLLTGASGFLGAFLLAEIMQQMPAARVHCLVRANTAQEGMRRVRERLSGFALWEEEFSERIVAVPGDLAKPSLGLSSDDFDRMANEIDTIYHNGASINFFYSYSELKPANVNGTSEILRLATMGLLKPVHYVSSSAVFLTAGGPGPDLVDEETDLDAISGLIVGYRQSKWVAERLVRIARERGVPVTIYRPGIIAADSRTGLANPDDLLSRILLGSLQAGAVPEFDIQVELAPVDYVSGALVWLSRQPDSIGKTFHLLNPQTVPWSQMLDWLIEAGMPVERLSTTDWLAKLHHSAQNSVDNAVHSLLPVMRSDNDGVVFPEPRFVCRRTEESLASSGWVCPPPGPEQFRLILYQLGPKVKNDRPGSSHWKAA